MFEFLELSDDDLVQLFLHLLASLFSESLAVLVNFVDDLVKNLVWNGWLRPLAGLNNINLCILHLGLVAVYAPSLYP